MDENKKDASGCCSTDQKCCCAKKLMCLVLALLIFAIGYWVGKDGCPFVNMCPIKQMQK